MSAARTSRPRPVQHTGDGYFDATHRPIHALVFVSVVLAVSHAGAALSDSHVAPASRLDLLRLLGYFHITARFLAPLTIVAVLLGQHIARRDPWKPQPATLAGMVCEGLFWTLPLLVIGLLRGQLAPASGGFRGGADYLFADLGAAVYEEFVFRLVLINLALLIFVDIFSLAEKYVLPAAAVVSALLFALYHPLGAEISVFWPRFLTHSLEGLLWATLLIYRGFGISVLSHVSWNLFVHVYYAIWC